MIRCLLVLLSVLLLIPATGNSRVITDKGWKQLIPTCPTSATEIIFWCREKYDEEARAYGFDIKVVNKNPKKYAGIAFHYKIRDERSDKVLATSNTTRLSVGSFEPNMFYKKTKYAKMKLRENEAITKPFREKIFTVMTPPLNFTDEPIVLSLEIDRLIVSDYEVEPTIITNEKKRLDACMPNDDCWRQSGLYVSGSDYPYNTCGDAFGKIPIGGFRNLHLTKVEELKPLTFGKKKGKGKKKGAGEADYDKMFDSMTPGDLVKKLKKIEDEKEDAYQDYLRFKDNMREMVNKNVASEKRGRKAELRDEAGKKVMSGAECDQCNQRCFDTFESQRLTLECKNGTSSSCYLAAANGCQCAMDTCGTCSDRAQLQKCVDENNANASQMRRRF